MIDKAGFIKYKIEPNLPSRMNKNLKIDRKERFPIDDSWAIGRIKGW